MDVDCFQSTKRADRRSEYEYDADADHEPLDDYLPKEWMVFQLLGPFAQAIIQMNSSLIHTLMEKRMAGKIFVKSKESPRGKNGIVHLILTVSVDPKRFIASWVEGKWNDMKDDVVRTGSVVTLPYN